MHPTTSLGAVLTTYGGDVEVRELQVPDLEPMAALVQVEASTMCGSDAHIHSGEMHPSSRLPILLGHEAVGRVVALGPERTVDALGRRLEEGDRVVWSYAWCGSCYWCTVARQPTLCSSASRYGWGPADQFPLLVGGYSEYLYIYQRSPMLKVDQGLDAAVVASTTCAFRTVVHGFDNLGVIRPHETIVIQGSGAVGLYALAYSLVAGASNVVVFGAPDERLKVASAWGANATYDIMTTSPEERMHAIQDATDGRGADVVVECSGAAVALEEGVSLLRRGGRYLVIGPSEPKAASIYGTQLNLKQLTVIGSRSGAIEHFYKAIEFVKHHQDEFDFRDLLGHEYGLNQVNDAIEAVRTGRDIKPVVVSRVIEPNSAR